MPLQTLKNNSQPDLVLVAWNGKPGSRGDLCSVFELMSKDMCALGRIYLFIWKLVTPLASFWASSTVEAEQFSSTPKRRQGDTTTAIVGESG